MIGTMNVLHVAVRMTENLHFDNLATASVILIHKCLPSVIVMSKLELFSGYPVIQPVQE